MSFNNVVTQILLSYMDQNHVKESTQPFEIVHNPTQHSINPFHKTQVLKTPIYFYLIFIWQSIVEISLHHYLNLIM